MSILDFRFWILDWGRWQTNGNRDAIANLAANIQTLYYRRLTCDTYPAGETPILQTMIF